MRFSHLLTGSAFLALATPGALAQSPIFGLDVRLQRFFSSTADANFVTNFAPIAANNLPVFALDFDETATTLWGINNTTEEYGTFDLTTGVFTPLGVINVAAMVGGATGLTCAVDGTWYMSSVVGADTQLFVGNVTTGTFALVGTIATANLVIDISINSQGQMYANSISTDSLYSVDTSTGVGTLIGPTGFATNFAQGMDFDWSTDTLYATLYTGGGTGQFATFNLLTGAATSLVATTPLNSEMEISVKVPAPGPAGPVSYCTAGTSTTGCQPTMSGTANLSATFANPCSITASGVDGQKFGILFYSVSGQNSSPWCATSTSFLCVKAPTQRTPSQNSGGTAGLCDGSMTLDVNAYMLANPASVGQPFAAGNIIDWQGWYRDPPACKTTQLTDGLEMTVQP